MSPSPQQRIAAGLFALLLLIALARAAGPIKVTDAEAASHIGEYATVEGTVAAVFTSDKGNTFLNFGGAYPNQRFSGVIFNHYTAAFSDLLGLKGKRVQLTGTISRYRGRPQIILESAAQLKVLERP